MKNVVIVGSQWGDEGKGKIVDWLSSEADVVIRFQGGHNAGHTLVIDGVTYKLRLLPSGIVRKNKISIIGNGVVVDPWALLDEIEEVKSKSIQSKDEIKVVIDCGNGAAGVIAPKLFIALGFNVVEIYSEVDGNFPNHHPDPGNPENLKDLSDKVLSEKANIGLAFDGDGDRLGVVDNKGKIIPQDKFLMLLAKDILKNSPQAKIIFDVKCTNRLKDVILSYGGEPIMSPTGHFHIKKMLRKTNAHLAGEMSGHIFFNDDWYGFDDAHYSGFRLIKILIENESELSELLAEFPDGFTTPEINLDVDEDKKFQIVDEFKKSASFENASVSMLDGLRVEYEDGWGLLRASNTTPKLVLRFEGTSQKSLDGIIQKFDEEFQKVHPNLDKIIDQI